MFCRQGLPVAIRLLVLLWRLLWAGRTSVTDCVSGAKASQPRILPGGRGIRPLGFCLLARSPRCHIYKRTGDALTSIPPIIRRHPVGA